MKAALCLSFVAGCVLLAALQCYFLSFLALLGAMVAVCQE